MIKSVYIVIQLLLGLALYGYVSKSTQTTLAGNLMPTDDMVLLQAETNPVQNEVDATISFLNGAHSRIKEAPIAPAATANLQAQWGRQIAFGDVVKSGALIKRSDGNYGESGGFTMGEFFWLLCL